MTSRRGGFLVMDLMVGIAVVIVLLVVLAMAAHSQRRALHGVNHSAAAAVLAERVLSQLRSGQVPADPPGDVTITITVLNDPHPLPTRTWVNVEVHHEGGRAAIVGDVPKRIMEREAQP